MDFSKAYYQTRICTYFKIIKHLTNLAKDIRHTSAGGLNNLKYLPNNFTVDVQKPRKDFTLKINLKINTRLYM